MLFHASPLMSSPSLPHRQVLLTAPLARYSGKSVSNRNSLLFIGFALMAMADFCFGMPLFANPAGGQARWGMHLLRRKSPGPR